MMNVSELTEANRQLTNEVNDLRAACAQYMEQIQTAIRFLCGPNGKPEHFSSKAVAANALLALTDDERTDLLANILPSSAILPSDTDDTRYSLAKCPTCRQAALRCDEWKESAVTYGPIPTEKKPSPSDDR